jgi:hypothetical protein
MLKEITSEIDMESYLEYFKNLDSISKNKELELWEKKILGEHNNYELLTFYGVLDYMGIDTSGPNDLNIIDTLCSSKNELNDLVDCILDKYDGHQRQNDLLDEINNTLKECDMLEKYYKEKIIN